MEDSTSTEHNQPLRLQLSQNDESLWCLRCGILGVKALGQPSTSSKNHKKYTVNHKTYKTFIVSLLIFSLLGRNPKMPTQQETKAAQ